MGGWEQELLGSQTQTWPDLGFALWTLYLGEVTDSQLDPEAKGKVFLLK